jgi:protein-S-isoprenylcysteine O-methyltransferase Ste14
MLGTFGLAIAPLLPGGPVLFHSGTGGAVVESVVLVVALSLAVATLHTLGQAFSLTPQARNLVSSGPYRLVRHPLYLCEAMAMLCVTVASGRTTILLICCFVLAAQVRRAQLEERLLRAAFPEYDEVFEDVPHFLPAIY